MKGDRQRVAITSLASNGAGVGRLAEGKTVFVPRSAPGDEVDVRIVKEKRRWAMAEVEAVLETGPDRVEAPCPYFNECGGCSLQHLSYEAQLAWKAQFVVDAFRRIGGIELDRPPGLTPSPTPFGYRNRLTATVRAGKAGTRFGFHGRGSPDVIIDVEDCLLGEGPVRNVWRALREITPHLVKDGRELRATIRLEGGAKERPVSLVLSGGTLTCDPELVFAAAPEVGAVWHVRGGDAHLLASATDDVELRGGTAFSQVSAEGGLVLHAAVMAQIENPVGKRVVDAYAGVGQHGRRLAELGATVSAIESDPQAAAISLEAAPHGFTMLEGTVEARLAETLPADIVILNPPRSGVSSGVLSQLRTTPPELIVYVSCDPATLARDVRELGPRWEIGHVELFDLFPQTPHVETLITMDRPKP